MLIDLVVSDLRAYRELRARPMPSRAELIAIPVETPAHEHFGLPQPFEVDYLAYWYEYLRGRFHMEDTGEVSWQNPYVAMVADLIADSRLNDKNFTELMKDLDRMMERVTLRLQAFDLLDNPYPVTIYPFEGEGRPIRLRTVEGREIVARALDGYHRMGAAILSGRTTHPATLHVEAEQAYIEDA